MKLFYKQFCLFLLCLLLVPNLKISAQTDSTGESGSIEVEFLSIQDLMNLGIITATKTEVRLTDVPAATSVITRSDIQKYGYRTLSEALARVPEVYSHYEGHNSTSDFRGFFANNVTRRVLYMINGHRVNDRFHFGDFEPDIIGDLSNVERIEVIRGPGAALYGSVAVLGVVNIITKDPMGGEKNSYDFNVTADNMAGGSLFQKYNASILYNFNSSVNLAANLYWFRGNTRYDTRTSEKSRPWTSSYATDGTGIANIKDNTDFYLDVPDQSFDGGIKMPNFNFQLNTYDFTVSAFLHTKISSWVWPKDNSTFNSDMNTRSWGTGAAYLEWKPSKGFLEKYDLKARLSYNINTNRETADFSSTEYIRKADGSRELTKSLFRNRFGGQYSSKRFLKDASGKFYNYNATIDPRALTDSAANLHGGGGLFNYAGIDKSLGFDLQASPYKTDNLNIMVGGNYENAEYENLQWFSYRDKTFIGWAPGGGISDKGWYYGLWAQVIWTPLKNLTLTAGARFDNQQVSDVYRQLGRTIAYEIVGQDTLTVQRQNKVARDFTPRISVNYRFNETTNLRVIYAEAFRAVPPQEIIRLPRKSVNNDNFEAESEKTRDMELIFSKGLSENLNLTLNAFHMNGNAIYQWNPALQQFNAGSGWKNTGGSAELNYADKSGLEAFMNMTYYRLRKPSDAFSFMKDYKATGTPPLPNEEKPLDSPTLLFKLGSSYTFGTKTTVAADMTYNGSILILTPQNNNTGDPNPATPGTPNFLEYEIPSGFLANLTVRQDMGYFGLNGFYTMLKVKNLLNSDVYSVLNNDMQGWDINTYTRPNQLPGFGRQVMIQFGYSL